MMKNRAWWKIRSTDLCPPVFRPAAVLVPSVRGGDPPPARTVVPLLAMALLGFFALRWPAFGDDRIFWQGRLVMKVAFPNAVHGADIDGDGDLDIVGGENHSNSTDRVNWWENTAGDGSAWTEHTIGQLNQVSDVFTADLDGDGDLDALVASSLGREIVWWENAVRGENRVGQGALWRERSIDDDFDGALSVYAADVDNDGDQDVIGAASGRAEIAWWENVTGDATTWRKRTIESGYEGARSTSAVDVDGDGDLDVLGAAYDLNEFAWWENLAGDGSAWVKHLIDDFYLAQTVSAADVDGDGDQDILGAPAGVLGDGLTWWENIAGNGRSWTRRTLDAEFNGGDAVIAEDIDADGHLDVLSNSFGVYAWWRNVWGDGSEWKKATIYVSGLTTESAAAADIDGDGDLDVIGSLYQGFDQEIGWFENRPVDGPQLRVTGGCPGGISMRLGAATGDAAMTVIASSREGASSVPEGAPCAGLPLGLEEPTILTTFVSRETGGYVIETGVGSEDCGTFLQVVDNVACEATNVTSLP